MLAGTALAFWPRLPLDAYESVKLGFAALLCGLGLLLGFPMQTRRAARVSALVLLLLLPGAWLALDLQTYWLGSPQRAQGALALLLVLGIGACVRASVATRLALQTAAVWTTLALAVLALAHWAGYDALRTGATRPGATLGSPLLLGQWLLLALPLCALAACRGPGRGLAGCATVLGLLALLASEARGVWLALLLVGLGAAIATRVSAPWRWPAALLGLLLCGALSVWIAGQRPASLEHRVQLWQGGLRALAEAPATLGPMAVRDPWTAWRLWFGYGADLQVLPLRQTAAASLAQHGADPDRAHQWVLDLLLRHGLWGLALALLATVLWWRRLQRHPDTDRVWHGTVLGALLAWLLSLQTAFALSADALLAALLAGSLGQIRAAAAPAPDSTRPQRRGFGLLLWLTGLFCWWLPPAAVGPHWRRPEQALLAFDTARRQLLSAPPAPAGCASVRGALAHLETARRLDPWRPEYASAHTEISMALGRRCGSTP